MITGYPLKQIYEEIAFIAYHFHWSYEEIVNMEHKERQKWVREISQINQNLSGKKEKSILDFM